MRSQLASSARSTMLGELVAFIGIGGGAAIAYVAVSSLAVSSIEALPAWLVSALCYAGFIVPVYLLHRRFAFRSESGHGRALPRYVAVQLTSLVLATIFSWLAYGVFGMPTLIAATLVTGLTSGVNFLVLRRWAFT